MNRFKVESIYKPKQVSLYLFLGSQREMHLRCGCCRVLMGLKVAWLGCLYQSLFGSRVGLGWDLGWLIKNETGVVRDNIG